MSRLFTRIRQRNLVQWLLAYSAGAWIAFEVAGAMAETWLWPAVVGRVVFVVLSAGLGLTAVVAWFHGERGHQSVPAVEVLLLLLIVAAGATGIGLVLTRSSPEAMGSGGSAASAGGPAAAASSASGATAGDLSRSILVLPFADLSPDGGSGYLGDGIAETLINGLARIEELRVVARTSAFAFRNSGLDVREIAGRLDAGTVLEGSVAQVGDRVRITANLYDAGSGRDLWSERFDRETSTAALFDLQDEVAQAILDALAVELGTGDRAGPPRVVSGGTRSQEAQRAYFLGLHHWTARTTDDMVLAARYFDEAVAADSTFADAWAGLALAYTLHTPSEYRVPGFSMRRGTALGIEAANRALELDSANEAAYTALGDAMMQRGRWSEAEGHLRRAIELNPGYAGAHHWLADLLMIQGRGEEALEEIAVAESLSPVAPAILVEKGSALMTVGRTQDALEHMDRTLALLPDAQLARGFSLMFSIAAQDWERTARDLAWAYEAAGTPPDAAARAASEIRDPTSRVQVLRGWQAGQIEGPGGLQVSVWGVGRPELRLVATRVLDGGEAALDLLEEVARSPASEVLYGPVLPALLGAEVSSTERATSLIRLAYETRQ